MSDRGKSLDKTRSTASARATARRSRTGRLRQSAPRGFWRPNDVAGLNGINGATPAAVIDRGTHIVGSTVNRDVWRFTVHRNGHGDVDVTDKVTGVTWTEPKDTAVATGTITWIDPKLVVEKKIVQSGDTLICEHASRPGGSFVEIWRYRMREPSSTETTGERSFNLANDLLNLQTSIDDFKFTKEGGKKPLGWRVDEVVAFVCQKYGIPAIIPVCEARITNRTWLNTDGLTVINDAYRVERTKTGRRFVIAFRKGTLVVSPLRRSKALVSMSVGLIEAVLSETVDNTFATEITLRANPLPTTGTDSKGRPTVQGFKISVDLASSAAVNRWGVVHRIEYVHGLVSSEAEATQLGLRHLAKIAKVQREVVLTHPGIPSIKKGDAIYVSLKDLGLRVLVWVGEITHTLDTSGYSMDVTCVFDDPYANVKADRVDENEAFNTKQSGTSSGKSSGSTLGKQPKSNKNRVPKPTAGDRLKSRSGNLGR